MFADLSGTTGRKRITMMKINEMKKDAAMNYVKRCATLEEAIDKLTSDTLDELEEWVENMDEYELFELIQSEYNEDIHRMDELDNVFDYMKPTEVLEELSDIDLSCEYFDADNRESFDDLFDYLNLSAHDIAEKILNGDIDVFCYYSYSDAADIMRDYDLLRDMIEYEFNYARKRKENAEKLFKMAMEKNPDEVIALLWNMSMGE